MSDELTTEPELTIEDTDETPAEAPVRFRVCLSGLPAVELVEHGQAIVSALVGHVTFEEPPTRWYGHTWAIEGTGLLSAVEAQVENAAVPCTVNVKLVE